MNKGKSLLIKSLLVISLILSCPVFAHAEDPLAVGPDVYSLNFENERVRVLNLHFAPGAKIATHSHPDHFVYVLTSGKIRISHLDGTSTDFEGAEGQVVWIPAETHSAENIGGTDFRAVVVELK